LTATLRSASLIELESHASFSAANCLSRIRAHLRSEVDTLFQNSPQVAAVLRAMLLGDRSFVDREESVAFQKTGVFHVLVVAGLHVGSFAVFLYWLGRKFQLPIGWTTVFLLLALGFYVTVIEQRPPVLRAALMATVLILGGYFFRRLELLNSAAIAALLLIVANPLELRDSSFQLSFLSIGCIAGVALPWLDRSIELYLRGLRGWRDVTRDASHVPRVIQFRIDLRSLASSFAAQLPHSAGKLAANSLVFALRVALRVWELVFLTLVLQIGMAPAMAQNFHRVTLFGALANLLAVPLTGILVPAGFLLLLVGGVSHLLAGWVALPIRLMTEFLIHSVTWFSQISHGSYRVPGPPLWLTLLFLASLTGLCLLLRFESAHQRIWIFSFSGFLLLLTALIAASPFPTHFAKGKFELTVLDVGQGDSLLLVSPAGHTLLIDGGGEPPNYSGRIALHAPDPGEEAVSPYLWSRGFMRIDVVALTHAHQDHLGGLTAVLENFKVGELWIGREIQSPGLTKLEELARAHGVPIRNEGFGDSFEWDGALCKVLWPEKNSGDISTTAKNNDSLVFHLRYRNRSFLLPGDAEMQAEAAILSGSPPGELRSDVLKVGHHGSKNSTAPEFLAAVRPQLAIISAGEENPYGHPSKELLQRLQDANVNILRTDRNGAIRVLTDGDSLQISCFVDCGQNAAQQRVTVAEPPNHQ
jgi:competence protein ComEC